MALSAALLLSGPALQPAAASSSAARAPITARDASVSAPQRSARQARVFAKLWQLVNDKYVYPNFNGVDWKAKKAEVDARIAAGMDDSEFYRTMRGLVASLNDEHSAYLPPYVAEEFFELFISAGDYEGIGLITEMNRERRYLYVVQVIPGSTAEKGGQALLFVNKKFADDWDVGEINDFGNMWIFGDGPEGASGTIDYKAWTIKVPANAIPPEASATSNRNIVLSMYRSGYQRWGRPAGFDNPRAGCSSFDDARPVLQFQAVMKVTNNNKIPMKRWAPLATTRSGRLAFGCALGYDRSPLIEPGGSADITVEYYIEPGDAIAAITVIDLENGRSNKMNTPAP